MIEGKIVTRKFIFRNFHIKVKECKFDGMSSKRGEIRRIQSSGMLRSVALVRTDVSEERATYIFRVTKIKELGKTSLVTSNRSTPKEILYYIITL
jgi:hypothetical protein